MQYYAYSRISKRKIVKGIKSLQNQLHPLASFLYHHGYITHHQIQQHLFYDEYYGIKMVRPNFKKMLRQLKPHDTVIFTQLSRIGITVNHTNYLINTLINHNINIYVQDGNWYFSKFTKQGKDNIKKFNSIIKFLKELNTEKENEARRTAKIANRPNLVGGNDPRFYGKHKAHYLHVYQYALNHSVYQTAEKYGVSTRTISRIKNSGKEYFELKKNNK